ncbi:sugar-transfer associated ATP-grasp domain-containing protein [Massilia sp. GCM10023247]|uniref:sugar-transfer associated ATP-grasp domain-containing protein n=1 Tax=Massilia sp. GCM10023247 TaxID=3252643 RepID=UPI0036196952
MKSKYEMAQLRRPPNRLTPAEYELYNLGSRSWEEKSQFLGGRSTPAISSNNDLTAQALTRDKLVTYGILCFHKFPFPEIKAVGHVTRSFPGARSLTSIKEIAAYLETQAEFPIFMKPIAGNAGAGSIWVEAYADGMLQLRNGKTIPLTEYFERWLCREGILLQAVARPHAEIARRYGPRLATARIVVLMSETGPILHRAALRIPTGTNMIDNFQHGASGNLLGAIEIDTGIVSNVIGKKNGRLETISAHPDTGEQIIGHHLPDWEKVKDLCAKAAPLFPGIRYQSWDIAFTDNGPQTIEVNSGGDFDVLQLASGRGIADATWWKLFREPAPRNFVQRWFARTGPWNHRP